MADTEKDPLQCLERTLSSGNADQLSRFLDGLTSGETARLVSRLSEEDQAQLLTSLSPEAAAELIDELPDVQAAEMVENLPPTEAAAIVQELPSDERADLVLSLPESAAEAIYSEMPAADAEKLRSLSQYPGDVAGGLMITEFLSYPEDSMVKDVIHDMRANVEQYRNYDVQYAYVTNEKNWLRGVLRLRDLLLRAPNTGFAN